MTYEDVVGIGAGKSRSEHYRGVAQHCESIIRRLAPREYEWTLGASGIEPMIPATKADPEVAS